MLVARRGLSPTDLRLIDPQFLQAVRWTVFVEKAYEPVPTLQQAVSNDMPDGIDGPDRIKLISARSSARKSLDEIRTMLALD